MVDHNSNSSGDANDKLCGNYSEYYNNIQQQRLNQGLYVVSTPIGNLGDITLRALHTLQKSDVILCEDMRVSKKLLSFYNISAKRLLSYHEHNDTARIPYILELLGEGKVVSLISDAGTPIINDPGYKLLLSCYERGYYVTHLPGACSVINGIVLSGLPSSSFTYLGFFPYKSAGRRAILGRYSNSSETLIFLETPHRIFDTLKDIEFVLGSEREIVIMRELTKKFEERIAGKVGEILSNYESYIFRGEMIVLLKGGKGILQEDEVMLLLRRKLEYLKVKDAVKEIALISGKSSKDLYRLALELKEDES